MTSKYIITIAVLILISMAINVSMALDWLHFDPCPDPPCLDPDTLICFDCHALHSGRVPSGEILMPGPSLILPEHQAIYLLCGSCHDGVRAPIPTTDTHDPLILDCTSCHDPHTGVIGVTSGAHLTHTEGELSLACDSCHSEEDPLSPSSTVCDDCHSSEDAQVAKGYWSEDAGTWLSEGELSFCGSCHDSTFSVISDVPTPGSLVTAPNILGDKSTWGFYASGHGRNGFVDCTDCHDPTVAHIDGDPRTYSFDSDYYAPAQSGVAYADGYRLLDVGGEVPLMIPANYGTTFSYNAQTMKDNAFRLCLGCHDSDSILDDTPGDGITSNFKASLPNPPRNYSYAWGSGADVNEHVSHIMNYTGPFADSDWDAGTNGAGGSGGNDSSMACSSCHNVHGAAGASGSTNEAMIRDGSLIGRAGYGFSYVIEDTGSYPQVTSDGASRANSVGAIFRNNTDNMCGGLMCHGDPKPPSGSSYDASGSSWGTYIEYYRPMPTIP